MMRSITCALFLSMQHPAQPSSASVPPPVAAGRRYIVTAAESLSSGSWSPVVEPPMAANDTELEITDPSATNYPARFYKVEVPE